MKKKFAIIIISCDKRKNIATIFDYYFQKYWPNCKYNYYFLTENIDFNLHGESILTFNEKSLCKRLTAAITKIECESTLILCDDYFLKKKIKTDLFDNTLNDFLNQKMFFCEISNTFPRFPLRKKYKKLSRECLSLQPAFWNCGQLLECLKLFDADPWMFELNMMFLSKLNPLLNDSKIVLFHKNLFSFYNAVYINRMFFRKPWRILNKTIKRKQIDIDISDFRCCRFKSEIHFWLVQFLMRTNLFHYRLRSNRRSKELYHF